MQTVREQRTFICGPKANSLDQYKIYICLTKYFSVCKIWRTLSSKDRVAFSAPSGRPNGKQYLTKEWVNIFIFKTSNILNAFKVLTCCLWSDFYLKCVIWFSRSTRSLSLISSKRSFSSTVTVPIPSGLKDGYNENDNE